MPRPTMNGHLFSKTGTPSPLSFHEDLPIPEPRAGTVLVKVSAVWVHTVMTSLHQSPVPTVKQPFTPGSQGVGIIEAIGADVFHLKKGQKVLLSPHAVADENVLEPAQALLGFTSFHGNSGGLDVLNAFPNGMFAEYYLAPKETVTPVPEGLTLDDSHLALIPRFTVAYAGLLKGRLAAGETIIVTGATGQYGMAATFMALAMGAGKVIAAGRNETALKDLAALADKRLTTVKLTGDVEVDKTALRKAADGGAHVAFDIVGFGQDSKAQTAALKSLLRGGRMIIMGSMLAPWEISYMDVMRNDLEIIGKYMYDARALLGVLNIVKGGLLDLSKFKITTFPLKDLPKAIDAVGKAPNIESVFVVN